MTETPFAVAVFLVAVAFVLIVALAVRRVVLARSDRRHLGAERRVRPLAIALIEDDEADLPSLSEYDQQALADVLARYSRKLSGEARTRIGAYFRMSAALRVALGELRSMHAWRRAQAAYRLGDMCCPEVAPELQAVLDDKRQDVRASAARSLGRLGIVDAARQIIEQLVAGRLPYGVAGQALVELGPAAVPELRRISEDAAPSVRATALTVIGFVGDASDSHVALGALRDPSAEVREAAAEALGRIGAHDAEVDLAGRLDDRVRGVRAAAATALGEIDARPALPKLLDLASTDIFRPARAAARAVARIDPTALERAARESDASPHLQEAADRQGL